MINWKVRLKSKVFWMAAVPAVTLLAQSVAALFGFVIDLSDFTGKLLAVVECVFVVLALFGIVADPTVPGLSDSPITMAKTKPIATTFEDAEAILSK